MQKWENALAEHIAYSRHYTRVGDDSNDDLDDIVPLGSMNESLQVRCKELINTRCEICRVKLNCDPIYTWSPPEDC